MSDTLRATILFLVRNAVFLALGVMLARRRAGDEAAALVTTYLAVSVVLGLPLIGGAGVDWNVLFDANAACALAAAVAINRLMTDRVAIASIACLLLPIGGALGSARWAWLSSDYWLAPRSIESAETDRDVAFIRAHDGPAFCADLALCWRAGKPEEVDTWTTEQRGARDPALLDALARLVDERYYAVLHIGSAPLQLGSRFATALEQRYVVDHRGILGTVLVPRPDPHPP